MYMPGKSNLKYLCRLEKKNNKLNFLKNVKLVFYKQLGKNFSIILGGALISWSSVLSGTYISGPNVKHTLIELRYRKHFLETI